MTRLGDRNGGIGPNYALLDALEKELLEQQANSRFTEQQFSFASTGQFILAANPKRYLLMVSCVAGGPLTFSINLTQQVVTDGMPVVANSFALLCYSQVGSLVQQGFRFASTGTAPTGIVIEGILL